MNSDFWHECWETGQIGWHDSEANPNLVNHIDSLNLSKGDRVFIPFCGKTLDIGWLLAQGFEVAGVELSQIAVNQLFEELKVEPLKTEVGDFIHYKADHIDVFVGDFFKLSKEQLGKVDAWFDRGALVALPLGTRKDYAKHIQQVTNKAKQLLIVFDYDQSLMEGPPFSVPEDEIKAHFGDTYHIELLEAHDASEMMEKDFPMDEKVFCLNCYSV